MEVTMIQIVVNPQRSVKENGVTEDQVTVKICLNTEKGPVDPRKLVVT